MRNQFCWLGNLLWTSCWEKGTDNFFPAMQKNTRKCLRQLFFLSYWIEQCIFANLFVECPWIQTSFHIFRHFVSHAYSCASRNPREFSSWLLWTRLWLVPRKWRHGNRSWARFRRRYFSAETSDGRKYVCVRRLGSRWQKQKFADQCCQNVHNLHYRK